MRILALMAAAFLLLTGGSGYSALAGEVRVEVRPGLTVRAGDGYLSRKVEDGLYRATDLGQEQRKKCLADITADRSSYFMIFDLDAKAELEAENQAEDTLRIFRWPPYPPFFSIVVMAHNPAGLYEDGVPQRPAEVRLWIDDRLIEHDHWGQVSRGRSPVRVTLQVGWAVSLNDQARFQSEIMAAILKGRKMNLEAVLKSGETVSASFDLNGLDEALKLMDQKMAESDAVSKREIERLMKELAAMD